jgi:hypothetical protein
VSVRRAVVGRPPRPRRRIVIVARPPACRSAAWALPPRRRVTVVTDRLGRRTLREATARPPAVTVALPVSV